MASGGNSLRETGGSGGVSAGSARGSLHSYPHPYFDLSNQEIPRTVKELFRWCLFLYLSHSEIAPLINKKCSYVITDLVYDTESKKDKESWEDMLEGTLDIQEFELKMLLDYEIFGNAFCSISFPFDRRLVCKRCEESTSIADKRLEWHYRDHRFEGNCLNCKQGVEFKVKDKQVKRKQAVKLIRWFPEYIQIVQNEITGKSRYIYQIPRWLRKGVMNSENDENRYLVEDMPMVFLQAIKHGKDVELDKDNFYHMRMPSCSYYDQAYGIPPLLAVFKDAWLFQTYRRAQEAIAVEHVLPLRLLIPRAVGGDHSPHQHNDLGNWSRRMQTMVNKWRRDPNSWHTVPFPAEVQNIGGDAQALNVHNDMNQIRQQIAGGLDLPSELIYGNMSWSGSSVTLRMLENTFLSRITQLEKFLNKFVIDKLRSWAELPDIEIKHRDFKMADDAQQKQIALSLRQTNTLSDRTVIQELGFDYSTEQENKRNEEDDRNAVLMRQMEAQAEAQGKAQIMAAKFEAQAQAAREQAAAEAAKEQAIDQYKDALDPKNNAEMGAVAQAVGSPAADQIGGSQMTLSESLLGQMAENVIKATPPDMLDDVVSQYAGKNARLAAAIQKRLKTSADAARSVKPLPEQKPPRSANAGI